MKLTPEQKSIILSWMRTKPYFQVMLSKVGEEATLKDYLKDKSLKRLAHILWALKRRYKPKTKFSYQKSLNLNLKSL